MSDLHFFQNSGIGAMVTLSNDDSETYLDIDEKGYISIPPGVMPKGFRLVVLVRKAGTLVAQKDVGREMGGYSLDSLVESGSTRDMRAVAMMQPIDVCRAGQNVWTSWHKDRPNRLDIWLIDERANIALYQVGVVTHDNGRSWKLIGEYRYRGRLYQNGDGLVVRPNEPFYGAFITWRPILDEPEMKTLIAKAHVSKWKGKPEELDPPLGEVPGPGYARVQWYITFAGQTGQGPVNLHDGTAWVHGCDIVGLEPDEDGEIRLRRGDVISFTGKARFGSKPNGPPKLVGVKLVERPQ